ncbi:MAG: paraquat-inducible protein A [Thermodesulfobacteriota bacterium]
MEGKKQEPEENQPLSFLACPACDLLIKAQNVPRGHVGNCPRCRRRLIAPKENSIERILAITLAGLLVFFPAIGLPLLKVEALGQENMASVIDACLAFYQNGYFLVGVMVFLTVIVIPFLNLSLLFIISLHLKFNRFHPLLPYSLRSVHHLREWGMSEIYLLGVLVSIIKVYQLAEISYRPGFFCFLILSLTTILSLTLLDRGEFWQAITRLKEDFNTTVPQKFTPPMVDDNARSSNIIHCHECELTLPSPEKITSSSCPRCNAHLHYRIPRSLQLTWALLICSVVFLIPANILPIMRVDTFGSPLYSTIMDGVIYFFHEKEFGIGLIIFTASILVPVFKVIGLTIILVSIHFKTETSLRQKAIMFRFIEFIGRWSMLDIFVIAFMAALVDFANLSSTHPAPGAFFFTLVVISTMFAAISFDPRCLWDYHNSPLESRRS